MRKFIYIFFLAVSFATCQSEHTEIVGSLTIPERFHGTFEGKSTEYIAEINKHRIIVHTPEESFTRTEGTVTEDNGTTLFKADLENGEELVLLYNKDCCIGITIFTKENKWLFTSDYYFEN